MSKSTEVERRSNAEKKQHWRRCWLATTGTRKEFLSHSHEIDLQRMTWLVATEYDTLQGTDACFNLGL